MRSSDPITENMISSLDLMKDTGISRATLNNYIKLGLLPKPIVVRPHNPDIRARRIGYFPPEVLSTLEQVQSLKAAGRPIQDIPALLGLGIPPPKPISSRPVRRTSRSPEDHPTTPTLQAALFPDMKATPETSDENGGRSAVLPDDVPPAFPLALQWTSFAILSARIQDFSRLRAGLPPEEFFELIQQFRIDIAGAARSARMTHVAYSQDGLLCYCIPGDGDRDLLAMIRFSLDLRRIARNLDAAWKRRKGWGNRLYVNIGLVDGYNWVSRDLAGNGMEPFVFGSAVEQARLLCDFARLGSIWTTKTLLSRIKPADREGLRYGVRWQGPSGEVWTERVYALIADLFLPGDANIERYLEIASLPLTEIIGEGTLHRDNSDIRPPWIKDLPSDAIIGSKAGE
jgi:class 3 adenylate cyclase